MILWGGHKGGLGHFPPPPPPACMLKKALQRGHPFVAITRADIRTVGLVQSERPICHSPPPSREAQYSSRPRIQAVSGQQRLDDRSQNYKTVPEELSDGSLRLSSNIVTNKLHQLETRPRGSPLGCLHGELEETCGICFPSLQLGPHGPQKSLVGPDRDPLDSSNLASSALVASATQSSGTTTCPATKQQTSLEGSNRPFLDSPDVPTSTFGRISHLERRYQAEDVPEHVSKLLISATRSSTRKTYESSWQR